MQGHPMSACNYRDMHTVMQHSPHNGSGNGTWQSAQMQELAKPLLYPAMCRPYQAESLVLGLGLIAGTHVKPGVPTGMLRQPNMQHDTFCV